MHAAPPTIRSRLTFVLAAATFVSFFAIGASGVGVHAAQSAMARANRYDNFDRFVTTHRRWRVGMVVSTAMGAVLGCATLLSARAARKRRA